MHLDPNTIDTILAAFATWLVGVMAGLWLGDRKWREKAKLRCGTLMQTHSAGRLYWVLSDGDEQAKQQLYALLTDEYVRGVRLEPLHNAFRQHSEMIRSLAKKASADRQTDECFLCGVSAREVAAARAERATVPMRSVSDSDAPTRVGVLPELDELHAEVDRLPAMERATVPPPPRERCELCSGTGRYRGSCLQCDGGRIRLFVPCGVCGGSGTVDERCICCIAYDP